jgi:hypothetical protein
MSIEKRIHSLLRVDTLIKLFSITINILDHKGETIKIKIDFL